MVGVTIQVSGNLQPAGYRVLVKFLGQRMGVRGLIRNLDDGSVEIFADAPEEVLEKFLKMIEIKGRPDDLFSLHVENVKVYREGEPGYRGPWRSYEALEIDYGEEDLRPIERNIAESLEWTRLYFMKLLSEIRDLRREFKGV